MELSKGVSFLGTAQSLLTGLTIYGAIFAGDRNGTACLSLSQTILPDLFRERHTIPTSKRSECSNSKKESGWDFGPLV